MQIFKGIQQLEYIDSLIRKGATGSPRELAQKMHLSERQIYRIIEELRSLGFPIAYSTKQNRYYYDDEVDVNIEITVKGIKLIRTRNNK